MLDAPAARRRSDDGDVRVVAGSLADCDGEDDERQGEKRTRQIGVGGDDP